MIGSAKAAHDMGLAERRQEIPTPPPPLPEGEYRTTVEWLCAQSSGWEWRWSSSPRWRWGTEAHRVPSAGIVEIIVRRIAPATERVPWWESVGRLTPAGSEITHVSRNETGACVSSLTASIRVADDGTVEVLR